MVKIMGIMSIPNEVWWPYKAVTSKGYTVKLLEILKAADAPIIEVNGELEPDQEGYEWVVSPGIMQTTFKWVRIKPTGKITGDQYHGR